MDKSKEMGKHAYWIFLIHLPLSRKQRKTEENKWEDVHRKSFRYEGKMMLNIIEGGVASSRRE